MAHRRDGAGAMVVAYVAMWVAAFLVSAAMFLVTVRTQALWRGWSLSYPVAVIGLGALVAPPVVTHGNVSLPDLAVPLLLSGTVIMIGLSVRAFVTSAHA